jgi:putative transposase
MGHTYTNALFHCVFSTKERLPEIHKPTELWAYLHGIARNLGIRSPAIGGTTDHVHLLVELPSTMSIAEAVAKFKANSSRWLGEQGKWCGWQQGYGAFSVSASVAEDVKRYIDDQERHHARRNYSEEFRVLLKKSGVKVRAADLQG